jgi:hypothetical protein
MFQILGIQHIFYNWSETKNLSFQTLAWYIAWLHEIQLKRTAGVRLSGGGVAFAHKA